MLLLKICERGYDDGISQLMTLLALLSKTEPKQPVRSETSPEQQLPAGFAYVRRGCYPLLALVATPEHGRAGFVKFEACTG